MSTVFRDAEARRVIEAGYDRFRARLEGASERTIPTRFGETHVLSMGPEGAPPLVAVHGALASSAHLLGELAPLTRRFRVHAPDVIGQSVKSADRRLPIDRPAYAEWLVDVMDGLDLPRAHVLGVSYGGFVARLLAEHAPERIDRLVLVVPAGFVAPPVWRGLVEAGLPMMIFRAFPTERNLQRLARAVFTNPDDEWVKYFGESIRSYRLDFRVPPLARDGSLAAFTRPALVVGARHDLSFPGERLVARAKELLPDAEVLVLDCRHSPPTDDAFRETFSDRIARFLGAPTPSASRAPAPAA